MKITIIKKNEEIVRYLESQELPANCDTSSSKKAFKRKAESFDYINSIFYIINSKGERIRFFTEDEQTQKIDYIREVHEEDHEGRDKLESSLRNLLYGFKRWEIMAVVLVLCVKLTRD